MSSVDLAEVEAGLKALNGIDFEGAVGAIRSANIQGELQTAEQVAELIAVFLPEAMYAKDALVVLGLVIKAYQLGLVRSAEPNEPAMQHAEGRKPGGR